MPGTSQVLDEARGLLKKRLAELDDERRRLERALGELGESAAPAARRPGRPAGRRGPGRPPGRPAASPKKGASRRRRRSRKGGTRADQAVGLVAKSPGISASEIAKEMKIKPNYLYRVLGELQKEGRIKKKGRQFFPSA
jgi:DNA invertase Pin-like site-specific DNA recombinase